MSKANAQSSGPRCHKMDAPPLLFQQLANGASAVIVPPGRYQPGELAMFDEVDEDGRPTRRWQVRVITDVRPTPQGQELSIEHYGNNP